MNAVHRLEPAVEPLQNILGYLAEIIQREDRAIERLSDHQLADGHRFVFHQHELEKLPGITNDTFDADGPVWLAVERLVATEPPAIDPDLAIWIEVSGDPDRRPLVRQRVVVTVDRPEKDRLIAAGYARAEHCSPAIAQDASVALWSVRLHLEQRPDIVERLDRYLAGSWAAWATAERLRRRTIALHRRLRALARVAAATERDSGCEIVWGIGVSRWRHDGRQLDLPLLERLVEIEVLENSDAEIRLRPRMVGATVNLRAFDALSSAAKLAGDNAARLLETIERGGELSPFQPASFEPILRAVSSQLDPRGIYSPAMPDAGVPLQEAGDQLTVSDRWVIFARPRRDAPLLRDIERLQRAIEYAPRSECCLAGLAQALLGAPDHEANEGVRRRLSGVIGHPIDIVPAAQVAADQGDLFFPLPTNSDQMEIVRQLRRSDGVVVQGARGPDRTSAIANVVCHHLALGLRVLVVSRNESALARLSEKLPRGIRDLTVNLTGSDKEVLKHAESVVSRLLSIVETIDLSEQAEQVNRVEQDIIATSREISRLDDEVASIASRGLLRSSGTADLPLDALATLIADSAAYARFTDRPSRFLSETDLLVSTVEKAREARLRLASDLKYVDDELPEVAQLPSAATVIRLHEDLRRTSERMDGESHDSWFSRHVVATLGSEGAGKFVGDLETLAAAHRIIADEPWLAALSPVGPQAEHSSANAAVVVDFARDASSLLSRRAGFLTRPVEMPADAFSNQELVTIVERLSAGEKVFTAFSVSRRALKQTVDAIKIAGFAPKTAADWSHVRDYLNWRRHLHSLDSRWRSLAAEIGAPAPEPDTSHMLHGHERVAKSVEVAIVTAALAKRSFRTTVPKLSMPDGDMAELLGNGRRLTALAAAVRSAASRTADQRMELARLNELFSGWGAMATQVRADVLSQIGRYDVEPREIEKRWIAIRTRLQALHDRRADVELLDEACRAVTEAGAGSFARRLRTEPAHREAGGDLLLAADWMMAWNWAVLMRQTEGVGQHQRLRDLSDRRVTLETRLRELLERVVVARMHLAFAQNTGSAVRQAFTVFMITLRKMAATCSGPTAYRLRQIAREALESCYEGFPCQLMPAWRAAEQLPARLGAFDLVVIEDASQSDLRELTAMLRGRKVVVTEDDRPTRKPAEPRDRDIESIEHAFLRSVPVAIRPLLLPGAALCDLIKLAFPDRMIRLREHARRVDPLVLPVAVSPPWLKQLQAPLGNAPSASSMTRLAYSLEDEIATVAEGLSLARVSSGPRAEPTMEAPAPEWLSNRAGGNTPGNEARVPRWLARDVAVDEKNAAALPDAPAPVTPPWLESAVPVAEAEDAPRHMADRFPHPALPRLDDAAAAATAIVRANGVETSGKTEIRVEAGLARDPARIDSPALPALRRPVVDQMPMLPRRPLRRSIMAAAAVIVVMMAATSITWQLATDRIATSWRTVLNQFPVSWNAASPAAALPAGAEPRKLVADRIAPDTKSAGAGDAATSGGSATERIVSHAVLYQEDPVDPQGKRYFGTVTWHVEPAAAAVPASIKGDVEIDKQMKATLSLRPNVETEMPASHIMEVKFNWPEDTTHVGVDTLKGVTMKARESGRGAPLSALTAKVTPQFFMIALSAADVDTKRNVLLLKGKEWLDIPIVYSGGSRAVLAIEKGVDGERAFKDAFAAWGQ
jgi:hypothetical protein